MAQFVEDVVNQSLPVSPTGDTPSAVNPTTNIALRFDVSKFLEEYSSGDDIPVETYNPICQKKLSSELQKNIEITGKFRTDYDPVESGSHGGYSYITVRKPSSGKADAISGYGIVWRPSSYDAESLELTGTVSGTTITLNPGDGVHLGTNTVAFISNVIGNKIYYVPFEFTRDTDILTDCVFPENITPSGEVTILVCEPNIFIVDNDLVNADMYVNKVMEFPGNTLAYIVSGITKIEKNTDYYFKMQISEDNAIDFYLEETEEALEEATAKISCGARTPLSEYLATSNMDAFGISTVDTAGYKWYYDNIQIRRLAGEYAVNYFEFDISTLADMIQLYIKGYGSGYGGDGLKMYVWDPSQEVWEQIAENTFSVSGLTISNDIDTEYYATDNTIKIKVQTSYPSGLTTEAAISLDYIDVRSSYNSGVNIGGCVDVYIDDEYLKSDTVDVEPDLSDYINVIDFSNRVPVWIDKIIIKDSSPEIELTEGIDYIWEHNDNNYERSVRGQSIIKFNPAISSEVRITYYYSSLVKNVQNWVNEPHIHYKGQDILVRHKNIHLLSIVATTGDNTILSTIKGHIEDYVNTLTSKDGEVSLTYEGIKEYLYLQGVRELSYLVVTDNYRENGVKTKEIINVPGDVITINKTAIFRLEGRI